MRSEIIKTVEDHMSLLMPRERQFYTLFKTDASNLMAGFATLHAALHGGPGVAAGASSLREIEQRGDEITHTIMSRLHSSRITPFDRNDILALTEGLDDVVDLTEEVADTIVIDGIEQITPEAERMSEVMLQIGEELVKAVDDLGARKPDPLRWARIHELEHQGDTLIREANTGLFQNGMEARDIIRWKDVYALMAKTIDRTEELASLLESIAIKQA